MRRVCTIAVALASLPVWAAEPDPLTQDIVMLGDPKVTAAIESGSQAQAAFVGSTRDVKDLLGPAVLYKSDGLVERMTDS